MFARAGDVKCAISRLMDVTIGLHPLEGVNAGEKMHQRAGVKLHHGGMPNGPTGRLLLRDKQNEKRIASTAKVPETSSVASPSELPLPQLILRPAPAPLLNPKINAY